MNGVINYFLEMVGLINRKNKADTKKGHWNRKLLFTDSGGTSKNTIPKDLSAVQDDVRMLRQQMMYASSMHQLLPMLEKIFQLVRSVTENLQMTSAQLSRLQLIEMLEFVWNASKYAIVRWDELKESKNDPFLSAIRYAYQTVPVFINWDLHVSVIENVAFLCHHAIRNWKTTDTSSESS